MYKSKSWIVSFFCCMIASICNADIVEVATMEEYEKEVKDSSRQVFVQFYASWCSPCRLLHSEEDYWDKKVHDKVKIIRVDIQKIPELCRRYEITGIPHINMMDSQGNVLIKKIGTKSIVDLLSSYEKSMNNENFSVKEFINQTPKESS